MIKTVLAAIAVAAFTSQAHAVTVVQWDFEAAVVSPTATTTLPGIAASLGTGTATSVHASASTVYSTPAGNGSTKAISSNFWAIGDYWQFSFGTTGYSGLTLSFDQGGSGTGPKDYTLAYSTDGVTFTTFTSYSLPLTSNFVPGTFNSGFTLSYDLSAITALNNKASVAIRLIDASAVSVSGGVVGTGGTDRVDNFTVNLTPVPEADASAMLLAGLAALGYMAKRRQQA